MCVETVLTDDKKVWENVKDAKLKSPDYKGMTPEEAMEVIVFTVFCPRGCWSVDQRFFVWHRL